MIIYLGLHLDGQRAWRPTNRLGEITVGPAGLLGVLEIQLGLASGDASAAERVVQYRDCLKRCDSEERFYHRTFAADELGTAATLLGWRDLWHLHGWQGAFEASASVKLRDLGAVEALAKDLVQPSAGERLLAVLGILKRRATTVAEIRLLDPLASFPKRWREVLALLPTKQMLPQSADWKPGKGFLGKLQGNLRAARNRKGVAPLAWKADGTVTVARAETRFLAGAWLSSKLGAESFVDLIVAPAGGDRLDAICAAGGRSRQGLQEPSPFRPSLQVLPLALEILWEPLNFYGVLQFLTHPVCPVPGYARRILAAKLADRPGIGGDAWTDALKKIDEHYGGPESANAKAVREKIKFWVEHPRHAQDAGAPIGSVIERVAKLQDYFQSRLGDTDPVARVAFNAGFSQCKDFQAALRSLELQGTKSVRPRQLQRLVAQATARGSSNPLREAEVGAQLAITNPGAAIECCGRVLWWQLTPPPLPASYPWSQAELASLALAGAELPAIEVLLELLADDWLRPVFAAQSELILVLPPDGEEVHPIWQMIKAVTKDIPVVALEELISGPSESTVEIVHAALPRPRRWWNLPADVPLTPQGSDSFSSLELFVFNPYQWLLRYPARLRSSNILSVTNDFLLFGRLAHELIDRLFRRPDALSMNASKFEAWYRDAFDHLIEEEGAVLLMPGRRADLEGLRMRLASALEELRVQIAKSGAVEVLPELPLKGHYAGGELIGFADIVIRKKSAERALLDLKWAGHNKYPQKLRDNRHLQLAIYAELMRQMDGAFPGVAYFILHSAKLFAPDDRCFPGAQVVESASKEGTAQLWARFVETWKWRKDQVNQRAFEVALESVNESESLVPPDSALALEYLNPAYNDYLTLAGWAE